MVARWKHPGRAPALQGGQTREGIARTGNERTSSCDIDSSGAYCCFLYMIFLVAPSHVPTTFSSFT
jgi:hypothetical protein